MTTASPHPVTDEEPTISHEQGHVLRTERLVLEPMGPSHSAELHEAVVRHDSVMRWLATGRSGTLSDAETMCQDQAAHWATHGYGDFAVRDGETSAFLGRVGLRNRPEFGVDLGFAMSPHAEGQGIAREAGQACLDLAFASLLLPTVLAFALPDNERSVALLSRLGARPAGTVVSSGNYCLRFQFHRPSGA